MPRTKGFTLTEEHKRKIAQAHIGMKYSDETKRKISDSRKGKPSWWKGRKRKPHTEEWKRQVSRKLKGRVLHPPHSDETRKKISRAFKGKHHSPKTEFKKGKTYSLEERQKMGEIRRRLGFRPPVYRGEKAWNWKGGVTPLAQKIRHSIEYKLWRKAVFERDGYMCVWCGSSKSGALNADHIQEFALYPELRFAIDNGRTLCVSCHKLRHTK